MPPRSTPTTLKASNRTARGANPGYRDDQKVSTLKVQSIDSLVAAMPHGCQPRSTPTTLKASNRTARGANPGYRDDQKVSTLKVQSIDSLVAAMPRRCQPRSTATTLKASNRTARGANPGYRDDQKVSTLEGLNGVPAAQAAVTRHQSRSPHCLDHRSAKCHVSRLREPAFAAGMADFTAGHSRAFRQGPGPKIALQNLRCVCILTRVYP